MIFGKIILIAFSLFYFGFLHAGDKSSVFSKPSKYKLNKKILLIKDFFNDVKSKKNFTRKMEIKYFGEIGGILGNTIYREFNMHKPHSFTLKKVLDISLIGTLLQERFENILPNGFSNGTTIFYESENIIFMNKNPVIEPNICFVSMLFFKKKTIADLNNPVKILTWALRKQGNSYKVALEFSFSDAIRISSILGFKDAGVNYILSEKCKQQIIPIMRKNQSDKASQKNFGMPIEN